MENNVKPRIGKGLGWAIIFFAGAVDLIQIVLDWFVVGVAANRYIDIGMDALQIGFRLMKGINLFTPARFSSLMGASMLEQVPFLDGAPFWFIDAIVLVRTVQAEDKAMMAQQQAAAEEDQAAQLAMLAAREDFENELLQENK